MSRAIGKKQKVFANGIHHFLFIVNGTENVYL